jgi:hypothetical protein
MHIINPVQWLEHILKPDDGHIGLKHVVQKKNCECVKVTDKCEQL